MAAALVGKGQALLELERPADALASFEAAQHADPQLTLAPRIETLRFRVVEDSIGRARALAKDQRWDEARAAYEAALQVSPDSAVLYRELAGVERQAGLVAEADAHLGRALELDPQDRATQILLAETREEAGDFDGAIASYEAALKLEPSADVEARLVRARERADLARLPEEFQTLSAKPEATRADLAAALALRVPGLLARAPTRATPVITDLRGHWARPWIVATLRAGVLDAYPNHTFQPAGAVTRAELALAVLQDPRLAGRPGGSPGRRRGNTRRRSSSTCRARTRPTPRPRRPWLPVCSTRRPASLPPRVRCRVRRCSRPCRGFSAWPARWPGATGDERVMTHLTVANQLTLLRMLLIPAFVIQVLYGRIGWALVTFLTAGITDALDGLIARRAGQKTTLGAWLDPMADKLLLVSAFVVLTVPESGLRFRIPLWLTILVISRDLAIVLTVAVVNLAIGRKTFVPSLLGKTATVVYIVTCVAVLTANYVGGGEAMVSTAVMLSAVITVVSALHYVGHATRVINS